MGERLTTGWLFALSKAEITTRMNIGKEHMTKFLVAPLLAASLALTSCTQAAPQKVVVDAGKKYQAIEGFGTCLISWDKKFSDLYQTAEFQKIYVEEVGLNMLRINLWGPVMQKPVQDWRQISYKNFDLTGEGQRARVFLDFAKGIKKLNPNVRLIGTAWSPPAWMKENNSINGEKSGAIQGDDYKGINNRVKKEFYPHFAKWLVEMAKLHQAAGVPLYAVSPGNEVMFTQGFESCVWDAADFATIVKLTGEQLEKEGLGEIKMFGPETMTGHNWSIANPLYIQKVMADPQVAKQFDVFATHGYTNGFDADNTQKSSSEFWNLIKDYNRPYWMTEGGTGGHNWPEPLNDLGAMLHNSLVHGQASAFVPWQIAEEKPSEHALMTLEGMTPKTHVARHYFKFIRPGAVRVDATPSDAAVKASAYIHPANRDLTIVLTNPTTQPQEAMLELKATPDVQTLHAYRTSATEMMQRLDNTPVRNGQVSIIVPPQSIVTLDKNGLAAK
jgi:O-glycosyl hydrolase